MLKITSELLEKIKPLFLNNPVGVTYGLFYGFPTCCIESFCEYKHMGQPWNNTPAIGSGFVPCECCSSAVCYNWTQFKRTIQENRVASNPFPSYDDDRDESTLFAICLASLYQLDPLQLFEEYNYYPAIKKMVKKCQKDPSLFQEMLSRISLEGVTVTLLFKEKKIKPKP